ncbi:MAG: PilT/PilU family type 4a pilus ATPase [Deltaproteobacteria bacterium]|nr:PilT/PilU family type 4a pilus ATPase [Deltaproteobacteria bacterium]
MDKFEGLISAALSLGVSDIHITGGQSVVYRINGHLRFQPNLKWHHEEVDLLVETLLTPGQLSQLRQRYSLDLAISFLQARLRINIFNTTRGLSLAIRILPGIVPTIEQLNLHPSLREISKLKSGLILICGPTGVGKTTTIAAIINEINRNQAQHIITLEDPIEYRLTSQKSFIEQRELGTHMPTFEQGLLDVLREDPDVIVVGEIRDPETIKLTLNIAESGHLIIVTLHASNAEETLHRILNAFPMEAQDDIRNRLASTLTWLVVQELIYLDKFGFRVPLLSILRGNQALKGTIRENKLHQIENIMQLGKNEGMFTVDRYLNEYLMHQKSLIPPVKIFQPSLESPEEIVYHSPVMNALKEPSNRYTTDKKRPSESPLPASVGEEPSTFSHDGKTLKDFIEELDKKYK